MTVILLAFDNRHLVTCHQVSCCRAGVKSLPGQNCNTAFEKLNNELNLHFSSWDSHGGWLNLLLRFTVFNTQSVPSHELTNSIKDTSIKAAIKSQHLSYTGIPPMRWRRAGIIMHLQSMIALTICSIFWKEPQTCCTTWGQAIKHPCPQSSFSISIIFFSSVTHTA